jgi:hypothetical protein
MFVMMEPRDACCLARRRLEKAKSGKKGETLTLQAETCCKQVIDLAEKLPPHAALVLMPAEFESFYMPQEPGIRGGEILTPEDLERRIATDPLQNQEPRYPADPNDQPDPSEGGSAPFTAAPKKPSWRDNPQGQLDGHNV